MLLKILFLGSAASLMFAADRPPVCSVGAQQSFRAGQPARLDGSKSRSQSGGSQLRYAWSVLSAPETVAWTSAADIATPTFLPAKFGTYAFQLTVTDAGNQSSSCTVRDGSVVVDEHDNVLLPDPKLALLLSPLMRWGASPWPWFDRQHRALADLFGPLQKTDFADVWNKPLPGNITVINGSPVVTGTGTNFVADLCAGGNNGNEMALIVWYPLGDGKFGRWPGIVNSCESPTRLTMRSSFPMGPGGSGLSFSGMNNTQVSTWINSSDNANYYDNVMAFYVLYYRTGIDTYRDYARTLADYWWSLPWVDQGRTCRPDGTAPCFSPRRRSFTGLMLRALDGRPEMWAGLRQWWDNDRYYVTTDKSFYDIREQGYQLANVAMCALLDPDASHRQTCARDVLTSISKVWLPAEQPGGNWMNYTFGNATWNGQSGTVTVTHGSNIVVGAGTNWNSGMFPSGYAFWVSDAPNDGTHGDAVSYVAKPVDATHLKLDRPYEGAGGSGKGWQSSNLVGPGTQPFTLGIAADGFYASYLATSDQRARKMLIDATTWIAQTGVRPKTRGLYYGRVFPNCEPIRENLPDCSDDSTQDARFLSGEVINAFSRAYLATADPKLLAAGDNLFGAMFGKSGFGGPDSDGIYVAEIDDAGLAFNRKKAKDFGFLYGYGQLWSWLGARLSFSSSSGASPGSLQFDLRTVPHAANVVIVPNQVVTDKGSTVPAKMTCPNGKCAAPPPVCQSGCVVAVDYQNETGQSLGWTVRSIPVPR